MKEPREAIIGAVEGAADQRGNVGRAQEAMPRQLPHDFHVVIGKTEGRRLRRTTEPRPACRCDKQSEVHATIIPRGQRGPVLHLATYGESNGMPGPAGAGRDGSRPVGTANPKRGALLRAGGSLPWVRTRIAGRSPPS